MRPLRFLAVFLLVLLFGIAGWLLSLRLSAQLAMEQALRLAERGEQDLALKYLEQAVSRQPGEAMLWRELGELTLLVGGSRAESEAIVLARRSHQAFAQAAALCPLAAEAHYGLSRSAERLAQLGQADAPDPWPALRQAVALFPTSALLRYAMVRYLHRHGLSMQLPAAAIELAVTYPPALANLRSEPFWNAELSTAICRRLQQHLSSDADTANQSQTHAAIAGLLSDAGDATGAVTHYRHYLELDGSAPQAHQHIRLGQLLLQAGDIENAEHEFMHALAISRSPENDLKTLIGSLQRAGQADRAVTIYQAAARRHALSPGAGVYMAACLAEAGQLPEARALLERINNERPLAEAWYWLARIAEKQSDWDQVEIASQKATLFDPARAEYHGLFSRALARLKKWERAETEADVWISLSKPVQAGHYHHRAAIRQARGNAAGAAVDWEEAARLAPQQAIYAFLAGEANARVGELQRGLDFYRRATALEPGNERYRLALAKAEAPSNDASR